MATITEALAEIKLIDNKVEKKSQYIFSYCCRNTIMKDPLKDSSAVLANEQQSIKDLLHRKVALRSAIAKVNSVTTITLGKETKTIADWLVWRREAAPVEQKFLNGLRQRVEQARNQATAQRLNVVNASSVDGSKTENELLINVDEKKLVERTMELEEILGQLDGQLSMKNATITL